MKRLTFLALGALALSGCTGSHIRSPAVCNGKHRRPANLYASILPTLPVPLPASQRGGQSMVAPPSAPGDVKSVPKVGTSDQVSGPGAVNTAPAPRTSRRDMALSYLNC